MDCSPYNSALQLSAKVFFVLMDDLGTSGLNNAGY